MSPRSELCLVGPLPREGAPLGGAAVSFAEMVERFRASQRFDVRVVDTTRAAAASAGGARRALAEGSTLARTLARVLARSKQPRAVLFNASSGGLLQAGPWVARAARLAGAPLGVRAFGGSLDLFFERTSPRVRARARRTVLAAPLVVLQTRHLCERMAQDIARTTRLERLPTTRDLARPAGAPLAPRCRRFLMLAQMRPDKGVPLARQALEALPADVSLTLCGPQVASTTPDLVRSTQRIDYRGSIERDDLAATLAEHDALLFPSTYEGEGLPGAVIEAMQCGLPVIATRWRSLPELVEPGVSGLLVEPDSLSDLEHAMGRLVGDDTLFGALRAGAFVRGDSLRPAGWHSKLEDWVEELFAQTRDGQDATPRRRAG